MQQGFNLKNDDNRVGTFDVLDFMEIDNKEMFYFRSNYFIIKSHTACMQNKLPSLTLFHYCFQYFSAANENLDGVKMNYGEEFLLKAENYGEPEVKS